MSEQGDDVGNVIKLNHFELDRRIGGFPMPTLTVIEGMNDTGKSVLVQQVTYGALKGGFRVRYITTENTVRSLIKQMKALTYDVKLYFLAGRLMVTELHVTGISWNQYISKRYLNMLLRLIEIDEKNNIFIIDSLTYIVTHAVEKDILEFFSTLRKIVDENIKSVFITIHPYAFDEELLIRIRSICDGHISLSMKEVGGRMVRFISINKLRGALKPTNTIISFEVDPAFGIKVLPFSQAKA